MFDIFVHKRVVHAMPVPFTELISRGQLTMYEQVCHLQIRAAFNEMLDSVTSVTEHAVGGQKEEERKKKSLKKTFYPSAPSISQIFECTMAELARPGSNDFTFSSLYRVPAEKKRPCSKFNSMVFPSFVTVNTSFLLISPFLVSK
jgi:hypothetical protein